MSVISFSGLASGIDTASLVDALVKLEKQPITQLQQKQADLNGISGRLSSIKGKLDALRDAANGLDGRDEVLASRASSSDESSIFATASGGASIGTYSMSVTSLAQAERTYSDAFSSKTTAGLFGTGTLSIGVGSGTPVDIDVTATDTLDSVVAKINSAGAGVTAGLLFDGTNYRLQVSGNSTGASNAITFTETGTTFGLDNPANEVQSARDAVFSIDGFSMTRPTNRVDDAIPGVSLELFAPTTSTESVTISRDPDAFKDKVQSFVDAYNDVIKSVNKEFAYGGVARIGDSLSGDSTLHRIQSRFRTEALRTVSGITGSFDRLATVGVKFANDGTLELDTTKLESALGQDAEGVSQLFAGNSDAGVDGLMKSFASAVDEFTQSGTGILTLKIDSLGKQSKGIDDQIDQMQVRIDKYEERLRKQFSAMEQLVSSLQGQGQQMLAMMSQLGGQNQG